MAITDRTATEVTGAPEIGISRIGKAEIERVGGKLITFVVPCYNSQSYMSRCLDSLVLGGDDCEVIVVNDGSTDDTWKVACNYADLYPDIVQAVNQTNGGWGKGVNRGLAMARGEYFMIVDSDDHLDPEVLRDVISTMKDLDRRGEMVDLFITNYVYDHVSDGSQHTIRYRRLMPQNRVFSWEELGRPSVDQYIMIHATTFRTAILRASELEVPENTFYMDSYFLLHPLPYVNSLYYLDESLYYYLIGREGQTIDTGVLVDKIDQQVGATKMAIIDCDIEHLSATHPKMASIITRYISTMISISTIYLFKINTPKAIAKQQGIWDFIDRNNPSLRRWLRRSLASACNRKHRPFRAGARGVYFLAKKYFKFV